MSASGRTGRVEQDALALSQKYEGSAFVVVQPEAGGLHVAFIGSFAEEAKMPELLRFLADEMEKKHGRTYHPQGTM